MKASDVKLLAVIGVSAVASIGAIGAATIQEAGNEQDLFRASVPIPGMLAPSALYTTR